MKQLILLLSFILLCLSFSGCYVYTNEPPPSPAIIIVPNSTAPPPPPSGEVGPAR